jgi:antitoxin (DNA-binding transcriptional repressor) of toxin-antitoxin stability system
MRISVAEAEGQLPKLVKLAQTGVDVILTEDGKVDLQLVPISRSPLPPGERMKVFQEARQRSREKGPAFDTDAARSQDFLYDDDGLPA